MTNINDFDEDDYFLFINFKMLKKFLTDVLFCPECKLSLHISNDHSTSMGFANNLKLTCEHCGLINSSFTSQQCSKHEKKQGRNMFEVNLRTVSWHFEKLERVMKPSQLFRDA